MTNVLVGFPTDAALDAVVDLMGYGWDAVADDPDARLEFDERAAELAWTALREAQKRKNAQKVEEG